MVMKMCVIVLAKVMVMEIADNDVDGSYGDGDYGQ